MSVSDRLDSEDVSVSDKYGSGVLTGTACPVSTIVEESESEEQLGTAFLASVKLEVEVFSFDSELGSPASTMRRSKEGGADGCSEGCAWITMCSPVLLSIA